MNPNTPDADANDICFSLVCYHCDAGMHIDSHEQAVVEGWTDIEYYPDLPMANYIGNCPDCRETFDQWPTAEGGD